MFDIGLDNGIIVRGVKRSELSSFMRYPFEKDYNSGVEVCYWRKCWGLRNWFLREAYPNYTADDYRFEMTTKEVSILRRIIDHYLKHPEDWDDSIWTFDEFKRSLHDQKWNLALLHVWMLRHQDASVYFYDSY